MKSDEFIWPAKHAKYTKILSRFFVCSVGKGPKHLLIRDYWILKSGSRFIIISS